MGARGSLARMGDRAGLLLFSQVAHTARRPPRKVRPLEVHRSQRGKVGSVLSCRVFFLRSGGTAYRNQRGRQMRCSQRATRGSGRARSSRAAARRARPCRLRSDPASLRNYEAERSEGESAPMTLGHSVLFAPTRASPPRSAPCRARDAIANSGRGSPAPAAPATALAGLHRRRHTLRR